MYVDKTYGCPSTEKAMRLLQAVYCPEYSLMSCLILDSVDTAMVVEALGHTRGLRYEGLLNLHTRHIQGKYGLSCISI